MKVNQLLSIAALIAISATGGNADAQENGRRMPQLPDITAADTCVKEYFDNAAANQANSGVTLSFDKEQVQNIVNDCKAETGEESTLIIPENGLHFVVRPRPVRPFQ